MFDNLPFSLSGGGESEGGEAGSESENEADAEEEAEPVIWGPHGNTLRAKHSRGELRSERPSAPVRRMATPPRRAEGSARASSGGRPTLKDLDCGDILDDFDPEDVIATEEVGRSDEKEEEDAVEFVPRPGAVPKRARSPPPSERMRPGRGKSMYGHGINQEPGRDSFWDTADTATPHKLMRVAIRPVDIERVSVLSTECLDEQLSAQAGQIVQVAHVLRTRCSKLESEQESLLRRIEEANHRYAAEKHKAQEVRAVLEETVTEEVKTGRSFLASPEGQAYLAEVGRVAVEAYKESAQYEADYVPLVRGKLSDMAAQTVQRCRAKLRSRYPRDDFMWLYPKIPEASGAAARPSSPCASAARDAPAEQ